MIRAAALMLAIAIAIFAGCASAPQLPPCANVDVMVLATDRGQMYVFDTERMARLVEIMRAAAAGKCRLAGAETPA